MSEERSESVQTTDDCIQQKTTGDCYANQDNSKNTILQLQNVPIIKRNGSSTAAVALWDAGSTLSFITFELANKLQLHGENSRLEIITVGGECQQINSNKYIVYLRDEESKLVELEVMGIERISTEIEMMDIREAASTLQRPEAKRAARPGSGSIDLLIGFQYAAFHPVCIESSEHLLLMRNRFGILIAGSHPSIKERTRKLVQHATVLHATEAADFFSIESLGVSCSPACGSCKCGKCHPGGKNMTLLEEKELQMIKSGLAFSEDKGRWLAKYPWIKDPGSLPENKHVAYATLKSTETRLMKNKLHAETYKRQIDDMIDRKVAREVSEAELNKYQGQKFYLSHHDVLKPGSNSTAMRIVFNSSAKVNGSSLNGCLAKGPSLLNNILGILLRFRQENFAFIGDISKMFHSIDIPVEDQMLHLFLWRNLQPNIQPRTYAITTVNMVDRPASAIAQTALRESALEATEEHPEASKIIIRNSYMDDIPASVKGSKPGHQVMDDITSILQRNGFTIKEWNFSGKMQSTKKAKIRKLFKAC